MHIANGRDADMNCARIAGLALSVFCMSANVCARNEPPITYTSRTWQMQDGLPEETVQAFAQTRNRYLWIGTTGGLLRFDGARLILYDRDNTPAFTENN